MSSVYVTEPLTNGKVIMKTTVGELVFELWPKEAPNACRNFLQLCLDGYYDNTIFHRVIAGFIVQGGDPTGTGMGGEAAYGEPFADEFHSRLRFTHRGILAMANTEGNDNKSQFFITLNETMQLQKKNTIFGKIAGDTIYNLMKMAELEVDEDDTPLYPPKILSTEVFLNPFDDVVQRVAQKAPKAAPKKKKKKQKKALSLLSFGDEAADEDANLQSVEEGSKKKTISAHEALDDATLSIAAAVDIEAEEEAVVESKKEMAEGTLEKRLRKKLKKERKRKRDEMEALSDDDEEVDYEEADAKDDGPTEAEREIKKLKKSILKFRDPNRMEKIREEMEDKGLEALTPLEMKRQKYIKRMGGKNIDRQTQTLAKLVAFRKNIGEARASTEGGGEGPAGGASARARDWRTHVLKFDRDEEPESDGMTYVVEDPLLDPARTESIDTKMKRLRHEKDRRKW